MPVVSAGGQRGTERDRGGEGGSVWGYGQHCAVHATWITRFTFFYKKLKREFLRKNSEF